MTAEDRGWRVAVANADFPLWIGCGHYAEYPDGHLCFVEPSKPFIRRWLRRISTVERVEALANAVERIIQQSGDARDLRWWTDEEATRGGI